MNRQKIFKKEDKVNAIIVLIAIIISLVLIGYCSTLRKNNYNAPNSPKYKETQILVLDELKDYEISAPTDVRKIEYRQAQKIIERTSKND